ncbi:entericidin EcnAB [Hydrogenophaga laconesensis]|uniref:Small secreted protein n=1 Tax=Hydrogenophaga laconesensis TaxID=1805971 RepID=A0ABU1VBD1_9BURK|nr:entericidin EcnAB [Hydrogenophaga laconesensis]MDR7094796.1 putative small secreted protein [Hydrogenophaga laconesensis]
MKRIAVIAAAFALSLTLAACNTWSGVKQDAKEVGQAAGKGIERAGEKVQEVAK